MPILLRIILGDLTKEKSTKKAYLTLCGLCIIFVMGFRSRFSGTTDTNWYCMLFERVRDSNVDLLNFIMQGTLETNWFFSEIGFSIFIWVLANIFSSAQWLLLITAIIMTVCTLRFISKHSKDVVLSVIMFITLGLFTFNINGLRQCIAMSICLFAYDFIKEKKLLPFLLTVLIAISFHKSAIVFMLAFLVVLIKPKWQYVSIFVALLILFVIFADDISVFYDSVTGEDYAGGESFESGGIVVVLTYILIIIPTLIFNNNFDDKNVLYPLLILLIGLSFYIVRYLSVQIFERISYYFFYYSLLLLPSTISTFDKKSKSTINVIVAILCILLFLYRIRNTNFTLSF